MVFIEIDKKSQQSGEQSLINELNEHLSNKDDSIFILFYMEGCGPCNTTRPEWSKLKNVLSDDFSKRNDVVIVAIDQELVHKLKNIGKEPNSFPTIRYITNKGKTNENYEDSDIKTKDRTIDSFVEWIKAKSGENSITKSEPVVGGFKQRKKRSKRRWTRKYKRSINCRKPRGFSQKQYCKYGRKI
jgi:thiol-disulfide isomerase/thioredoxin